MKIWSVNPVVCSLFVVDPIVSVVFVLFCSALCFSSFVIISLEIESWLFIFVMF